MGIKKMDRNRAVNKIIDYIKSRTINNDKFIVLKTADAAKIIGMGNTFSVEILNLVKLNPSIIHKKVEIARGNAPYEFRYIEVTNFKAINYNNIGAEEKTTIEKTLKAKGLNDQLITNTLFICNALIEARKQDNSEEYILKTVSEMLLIDYDEVTRYTRLLIDCKVLEHKEKVTSENKEVALDDVKQEEIKIQYVIPNSVKEELEQLSDKEEVLNNNTELEATKQNTEIYNVLVENLVDFKGFVENFQSFFGETVKDIIKPKDNTEDVERLKIETELLRQEVSELKVELDKGVPVLEKYQQKFKRLNESLMAKDEASKRIRLLNTALEERNEKLINSMQERLAIMLAEMSNAVVEFAQTPKWKQSPSLTAKFQNGLTQAVTTAIQDIIHSNDNISENE